MRDDAGGNASHREPETVDASPEQRKRAGGNANWAERASTSPGPDSPYYVRPPTTTFLRWSIVVRLILPTVLTVVVVLTALGRNWIELVIASVLLGAVLCLRAFQFRAIRRELRNRRKELRRS
jgi:hypothetical protein